jgi:hypothetical protein
MSVDPPGGHGTISVTERVGNCCACATLASAMNAAASSHRLMSPSLEPAFFAKVVAEFRMPNHRAHRNGGGLWRIGC